MKFFIFIFVFSILSFLGKPSYADTRNAKELGWGPTKQAAYQNALAAEEPVADWEYSEGIVYGKKTFAPFSEQFCKPARRDVTPWLHTFGEYYECDVPFSQEVTRPAAAQFVTAQPEPIDE